VGSVSTNIILLTPEGTLTEAMYLRTQGRPMQTIQEGMKTLRQKIGPNSSIGIPRRAAC
jgi:activator of 2-hydroxyglutaryl-CoA dehydratase